MTPNRGRTCSPGPSNKVKLTRTACPLSMLIWCSVPSSARAVRMVCDIGASRWAWLRGSGLPSPSGCRGRKRVAPEGLRGGVHFAAAETGRRASFFFMKTSAWGLSAATDSDRIEEAIAASGRRDDSVERGAGAGALGDQNTIQDGGRQRGIDGSRCGRTEGGQAGRGGSEGRSGHGRSAEVHTDWTQCHGQAPTVPQKNLLCCGMLQHASSRWWG